MARLIVAVVVSVVVAFALISIGMAQPRERRAFPPSTVVQSSETISIPKGKTSQVNAACAGEFRATGGGFWVWDGEPYVTKNAPSKNGLQWEVEALAKNFPAKIQAYVVCARLSSP